MAGKMTLQDALKEALQDNEKVSKYEAKVIREIIMADDQVSKEEQEFLETALHHDHFDEKAFDLLSTVLLRSHLKQ